MNNRPNSNRRRGRGNNALPRVQNGNRGNQNSGNRIDNRARGNASQMMEKYKNMARDAQMSGDRVQSEYYLQFSDHYFRVLSDSRARQEGNRQDIRNPSRQQQDNQNESEDGDFDNHDSHDSHDGPDDTAVSDRNVDTAPPAVLKDKAMRSAEQGAGGETMPSEKTHQPRMPKHRASQRRPTPKARDKQSSQETQRQAHDDVAELPLPPAIGLSID